MTTRALLSQIAKEADARSARSTQRKVGASEIGVCRRRAGYSHHGHPYTDPENATGIAAIIGTWIHKGALGTMARTWGTLIEYAVETEHLRGHVDGIELPNDWRVKAGLDPNPHAPDVIEVDDLKTKRDGRMVNYVRNRGPKRSELFQGHLYGGMLRKVGIRPDGRRPQSYALAELGPLPVETIRLRYLARNGEEDALGEYVYEQPFDESIEAEAWEWVEQVTRSKSPNELPRDQDGPGLSIVCDNCPFMTACWGDAGDHRPQSLLIVTDADLAQALREYDENRLIESEAKGKKDLARAKLDASDRAIYTDGKESFKLGWTGGKTGDPKPDVAAMIALYEEAGLKVPYLEPKPSPRTISVTRWDPPEQPCGKPCGDPEPLVLIGEGGQGTVTYVQDRPRGGWTRTDADSNEATFTAGQFAKILPDYVDPRPPCILKKAHSGACWPDDDIRVLDLPDDAAGAVE